MTREALRDGDPAARGGPLWGGGGRVGGEGRGARRQFGSARRLMGRPLFALLLVAAALLQATVLPTVGPLVVLPNLVLVLVLVRGAQRGLAEALVWTALAGVLMDLLAMDPIGTNGLALLPVGLAGALGRRRFFQSGLLFPMVLAVAATVAHAAVLLGLRGLFGDGLTPPPAAVRLVGAQALLNALLVPPLYGLVGWLARFEPNPGNA